MAKVVLADTCYWLGLVDSQDQFHNTSKVIKQRVKNFTIKIPWPSMFESVTTRLIRDRQKTLLFEEIVSSPEVEFFNDEKYRENALSKVFKSSRVYGYSYSLVDSIIREILKDKDARINYLITYNEKDFADVCAEMRIKIINN